MGGRGPWRGPSAPRMPCCPLDRPRTTAFLAWDAYRVLGNSVSSSQNPSMRRADLHAARTVDDAVELSSAYPQPLRAAVYERGRIDG